MCNPFCGRTYNKKYLTKEEMEKLKKDVEKVLRNSQQPKDRIDILQEIADASPNLNKSCCEVKRGKLRFMIGLPRSGKSTWATKWMRSKARQEEGIIYPRVVVCADSIRLAVTGKRYCRRAEQTVFMIHHYMIESLLIRGHDVLCDETNTSKRSIRNILEIDSNATYTLINTPASVCKERAIATDQSDLIPVIDRLDEQLQLLIEYGIDNIMNNIRKEISVGGNEKNTVSREACDGKICNSG